MTLTVAFRNFANAHKNGQQCRLHTACWTHFVGFAVRALFDERVLARLDGKLTIPVLEEVSRGYLPYCVNAQKN